MNTLQSLPPSIIPTLFDTMNEGVWIGDSDDITLYVNQRFVDLSGYNVEEIIGQNGLYFFDEDTQVRIGVESETRRKKGLPSSYKGNMQRKDGEILHVIILGSPLPEGGTIGIITDVSEHVERKSSEKLLLSAIRQSLQGIILVKDRKITSWNRGAKFIFGYKEGELTGKSLATLFMKEDIKRIYETLDEDLEVEVLGKRNDGERLSLILTIVWSKDEADTCMILIRDISNIRKSEEMIEQKHDYLMQTVREYGIIKRKIEYFQELERLFYRGGTDLQKIYDFFVYSVARLANVGGCGLRILNSEKTELTLVTEYGLGSLRNGENTRSYTGSITEESSHKGKPVRILDLINDPRLRTLTMAHTQRFQSASMYAFSYHGQCIGSIMLFMEDANDPFDDEFLIHYIELFGLLLGGSGKGEGLRIQD